MGCADKLVVPGTACRGIQIVCLAVMSIPDMTASVLRRAATGDHDRAGVQLLRLRRSRRRCIWCGWGQHVRADAINDGGVFMLIDGRGIAEAV